MGTKEYLVRETETEDLSMLKKLRRNADIIITSGLIVAIGYVGVNIVKSRIKQQNIQYDNVVKVVDGKLIENFRLSDGLTGTIWQRDYFDCTLNAKANGKRVFDLTEKELLEINKETVRVFEICSGAFTDDAPKQNKT